MQRKYIDNRKLTMISFMCVIIFLLSFTPIGFISIGVMRATVIHIPVIIGAILMGPKVGSFLGFLFGLSSLIVNTFNPTITSFVFSPFYSIGDIRGNFYSLLICFIPRILIGFIAGYMYIFLDMSFKLKKIVVPIVSVISSFLNTLLVMAGIYYFFGDQYAEIKEIEVSQLFKFIIIIIGTNGILEAIVACVVCSLLVLPLKKHYNR